MALISWMVIGLVAGLLAGWAMPGSVPGGLLLTTILGMAGASLGGFLVGLIGGIGATGLDVWSIAVATFGAIVLLSLYYLISRRTV